MSSVPPVVKVPAPSSTPIKRPMPTAIHPMLATSIDDPFDGPDWLFEIKWDGYRAVAFIENGKVRLVSRNQNELTPRYPELKDLPEFVKAKNTILDGEVVALDEQGRASFSLMQQRTGFRPHGRRGATKADVPVLYYAFDLLYLDGFDWRRVALEERKKKLASILMAGDSLRYSDHYEKTGKSAVRDCPTERPGRNSRQETRQHLSGAPQQRVAEDKNSPSPGSRDRRLHRTGGQPRAFRFDRAWTI